MHNPDVTGYQSDSTDHLMSEILKERANRLNKQQENIGERLNNLSIEDISDK